MDYTNLQTIRRESTRQRSPPIGALILGGAHGSLAVARSLGRRKIPVWFVTHDNQIARFSRYTLCTFEWAGPHIAGALDWLLDLAARHDLHRWMLIAGGDPEVRLVAENHDALSRTFRVTAPPWSVAKIALDKRLTYLHAASVGVSTPWNFYPAGRDDVAAIDCRWPIILKPAYFSGRNPFTVAKAWRVDNRADLMRRYNAALGLVGADAIMLQEYIPGSGDTQFSYAGVWWDGSPMASLLAIRRRQYPVEFGFTSTLVETVQEPAVEDAALRYLSALGYSGLVELEFKRDERDDKLKLLDFNPRVWTWIALGARAGVDFPWLQWQLASGDDLTPRHAICGYAWAHMSRDVVSAASQIFGGTLSASNYIKSLSRPLTYAAFARDDVIPGVVDLPILLARVLRRRYLGK
jgi:D-aspartate ligase